MAALVFLAGCDTSVGATNPYDPETDPELQARSSLSGRIVLRDDTATRSALLDEIEYVRVGLTKADGAVVRTPDGSPLHARLEVDVDDEHEPDGLETAEARARFEFPSLTPGLYRPRIEGLGGRYLQPALPEVELRPGLNHDVGDLLFIAFHLDGKGPGQIAGSVRLEGGRGGGRLVELYRLEQDDSKSQPERRAAQLVRQGRTDSDGSFEFEGLPIGAYAVAASLEGFTPDYKLDVLIGQTGDASLAHWFEAEDALTLHPVTAVLLPAVQQTEDTHYTNRDSVPLIVLAFGGVTQMRLSTNSLFVDEDEEEIPFVSYNANATVPLPELEGPIEVFGQFRTESEAGFTFVSPVFSTTVVRDVTPPRVLELTVPGASSDSDGRIIAPGLTVPMIMEAGDDHSGVAGVALVQPEDNLPPDPETLTFQTVRSTGGLIRLDASVSITTDEDGEKLVYAYAHDRALNISEPFPMVMLLDRTPPDVTGASVDITGVPSSDRTRVNNVVVELSLGEDPEQLSEVVEMRVWNGEHAEPTIWEAYEPRFPWLLPPGDGEKLVNAKVRDAAGNESSPFFGSILLNQTPPSGPSLFISRTDEEAPATHVPVPDVTLHPAADGAVEMAFSNDQSFSTSTWESYAPTFAWTLLHEGDDTCAGHPDGTPRTVFARFRDEFHNVSETTQYTVFFDCEPPAAPTVALHGSHGANPDPDAPYPYSRHFNVAASIEDIAHASKMLVAHTDGEACPEADGMTPVSLSNSMMVPFTSDGLKRFCVRLVDGAGNVGALGEAEIFVLTTPPSPPILTPSYAINVNHRCAYISPDQQPDHFWKWQKRAHNGVWMDADDYLEPLEGTETIRFPLAQDTPNLLEVRAVDQAGNLGEAQFALIDESSSRLIPTDLQVKHICDNGRFAILKDSAAWPIARTSILSFTAILRILSAPRIALLDIGSGTMTDLNGAEGLANLAGFLLEEENLHRIIDAACAPDDERVLFTFHEPHLESGRQLRTGVWHDPLGNPLGNDPEMTLSSAWLRPNPWGLVYDDAIAISSIDVVEWTGEDTFEAIAVASSGQRFLSNDNVFQLVKTSTDQYVRGNSGTSVDSQSGRRKVYGLAFDRVDLVNYTLFLMWDEDESEWAMYQVEGEEPDGVFVPTTPQPLGITFPESEFPIHQSPWGSQARPASFNHASPSDPLHTQLVATSRHAGGTTLSTFVATSIAPISEFVQAGHPMATAVERSNLEFSWIHPTIGDTFIRDNIIDAGLGDLDTWQRYAPPIHTGRPILPVRSMDQNGDPIPGAPEVVYHTLAPGYPEGVVIGRRDEADCYIDPSFLP